MKVQKTPLTDYQAFAITTSINNWNQKNKASKEPYLNLDFFKKLFTINSVLKPTLEAISEAQIEIADLYKRKETTEYEIPLLDDKEFEKLVDGSDTYEIFSWIKA